MQIACIPRRAALALLMLLAALPAPASARQYRIAIVSLSPTARAEKLQLTYGDAPVQTPAPSLPMPPESATTPPPSLPPQHGRIGDKRDFSVEYVDPTQPLGGQPHFIVHATLEYQTEHTDLWIDDDIDGIQDGRIQEEQRDAESTFISQMGRFGSLSYTAADIAKHPMVPACNAAHERVGSSPLFLPSRGELLSMLIVAPGKTHTGYADTPAYMPQAVLNCSSNPHRSNELPGLMILALPDRTSDPSDRELIISPPHELQHLKNYVRHAIRARTGTRQQSLLNEGLSVLAQDFAVQATLHKAHDDEQAEQLALSYLRDPNNVSLLNFFYNDGTTAHPYGAECYGGAYLLQRFLYERYGDAYLDRVTNTDLDGMRAMAAAIPIPLKDALRGFGYYVLADTQLDTLRVLTGPDVSVLGGSVSIFESAQPVASIKGASDDIVWTEVAR